MIPEEVYERLRIEEGYEPEPYMCTEGFLTVGFGSRIELDEYEANWLMKHRTKKMWATFVTVHPWADNLPTHARNALILLVYQLGPAGVGKFEKTLKLMQVGDFRAASQEALDSKWAQQTPARAKRVAALINAANQGESK